MIEEFPEYTLIQQYYGDRRARRSGVSLMNHIDEGLAILQWRGASDEAKRAFCLHPLLQSDIDFLRSTVVDFSGVSHRALINAVEYRCVANEYLSKRFIGSIEKFE